MEKADVIPAPRLKPTNSAGSPRGPIFYSAALGSSGLSSPIDEVVKYDNTNSLQFGSGDAPFISFNRSPYQRVGRDLPCAQEMAFEPLFTHSQACLTGG